MKELLPAESVQIRVKDMCVLAEKRGSPVYSHFLNEAECYFCEELLKKRAGIFYDLWGGHASCTRKLLRVCTYDTEDNKDDFPIYTLSCAFHAADSVHSCPGHRDFLGAFMSLGITREQIGDIFVGERCRMIVLGSLLVSGRLCG